MARRPSRTTGRRAPGGAPAPAVTVDTPCPCGLPAPYGRCCGRFHAGPATAPTAELLMRSRYSAFVVLDAGYLLRTWDPRTRPGTGVDLDPAVRWTGLEILATDAGTSFHTTGTVEFRAAFTVRGRADALHERSRFARHDGAWVYLDGTFPDQGA